MMEVTFDSRLCWLQAEHVHQSYTKMNDGASHIKCISLLLGLSTETRYPTHPKKPSDPARKPSDPTPVTVGGGSPPPEPVTGGSVGGFSLPKSEKPEPTGEIP